MSQYEEVNQGERFQFGANWKRFLEVLNEDRIQEAELSLRLMLSTNNLNEKSFIDVGSGSGLFSLAAKRLGAKVQSFDYDPQSVACTRELKRQYFNDDLSWDIAEGSVLDIDYIKNLDEFDVVYSWGVLHHTGDMWKALENVSYLVKNDGQLFLAIYNDQGGASRRWKYLKKIYNRYKFLRLPLLIFTLIRKWTLTFVKDLIKGNPMRSWRAYKTSRGMSAWHDVVDWIGGYPFEVAKPEEIFSFFREKGFVLEKMVTRCGGSGCNEFVFRKKV